MSTPTNVMVTTDRRRRFSARHVPFYAVMILLVIIYISPFLIQVFTSFKTEPDAAANPLSLPQTWTTAAYERLFVHSDFPLWIRNSLIVTELVTVGRVIFDCMAGYALARIPFKGRTVMYSILVAVMSVPAVVLLIPKFLVIKQLGIYDSFAGMVLPLLADATGVFIMTGFFASIPKAIEEQARIDGAGTLRTFWSIVMPMARPAVVTIIILSFQGSWNELNHFIISTQNSQLTTLTKGVAQLASGQLSQGSQYPLKLAAALLMTIPVAVLFFTFQKQIMNSTSGAVKE